MYDLLLTIHVLCAVIWVGGAVMMHIFGRLATKDGPEQQLVFTRHSIRLGNMLFAPLALILLVAGVLLVNEVGYSYGDPWIGMGFFGFLVSFMLGVAYYPGAGRKYGQIVAGDGPGSPGAQALYRRTATVNTVELTILLLVIVAMTTKPG